MTSKEKHITNYWFLLITIWSLIAAIYLPLQLLFQIHDSGILTIVEIIVTVLFSIDLIYYQISLGRISEEIHPHQRDVPFRHRLFWFIIDFLSALPLGFVFGSPYLFLFRILKLFRVGQYFRNWRQKALKYSDYLQMAFFGLWFLIFSHWLACGWLALSPDAYTGDKLTQYISSLYWVIGTLTSVGYGETAADRNVQKIYSIIVMLAGVGAFGYIIGTVAGILAKRDHAKGQYFSNLDQLNAFVQYREIPPSLQKRIRDYFSYIWKKRLGYDEKTFLASLPQGLASEVSLHLKCEILDKIPLFKGVDSSFIEEVALNLKLDVFTPGEFIFKKGQKGSSMYFVIKGKLEVLSEDGSYINRLSDGDFFGEIALLTDQPRMASVRAITYCDLYILEKNVINMLMQKYPEIGNHMKEVGLHRQKVSS
jgi:hypothetical protein